VVEVTRRRVITTLGALGLDFYRGPQRQVFVVGVVETRVGDFLDEMPCDSRGSSFLFWSAGRRISLPGLRNETWGTQCCRDLKRCGPPAGIFSVRNAAGADRIVPYDSALW
jgi:hypothetical protein